MIDKEKLLNSINEIVIQKQINSQIILSSIKEGIKKAYEKYFDTHSEIDINIDYETGQCYIIKKLLVVEKVKNNFLEIELKEAQLRYDKKAIIGDIVKEFINSSIFSRLAIMQVKQILKQQIKEAEREAIIKKYINKKGCIIYGIVVVAKKTYLLVQIEKTFAYIPRKNLIISDNYNIGDYITFLIENINKSKNISQIIGTRISNAFLLKLLEREIPEIFDKIVEVKAIARNPGKRSKIAVYSNHYNVDPIGACIGVKGNRINKVTEELNNEKIDICIYSKNNKEYIINALSPVKVISIFFNKENNIANIIVPDEQLSLAIGKNGNTIKLVAYLTKYKLNIKGYSEALLNDSEIIWNGNLNETSLNNLINELKKKIKK